MIQFPAPIGGLPSGDDFKAWLRAFSPTLGRFTEQTVLALKAIAGAAPSYRTLTIVTDGSGDIRGLPIAFTNPLSAAPSDVHVARVVPAGASVLTGPVTVVWTFTPLGQIQINDVTGLDSSSSYAVTLAVL